MSLKEKLLHDQTEATKARERFRTGVIRMLRAELQNAAIAKRGALDPGEELAVLSREVKRRREALEDCRTAGRTDLLENLEREIALIQEYLPAQLAEAELRELARQAVAETGAASRRDLGRVMAVLMSRVKGKADGSTVRKIVEELLP